MKRFWQAVAAVFAVAILTKLSGQVWWVAAFAVIPCYIIFRNAMLHDHIMNALEEGARLMSMEDLSSTIEQIDNQEESANERHRH